MRPQDLTTAKTVAKISVVSNTAGGKKSVARRSTGLDYASAFRRPAAYRSLTDAHIADIFVRVDRYGRPPGV